MANQITNARGAIRVKGTVAYSLLTKTQTNKFGNEQYSITIANPEFETSSDPTIQELTEAVKTRINDKGQLTISHSKFTMRDNKLREPVHYLDIKTQSEVERKNEIGQGQPVYVLINCYPKSTQSEGDVHKNIAVDLYGVMFDDVSKVAWFSQNTFVAGFHMLDSSDENSTPVETAPRNPEQNPMPNPAQAPGNGNAQAQDPFGSNAQPQQNQDPFGANPASQSNNAAPNQQAASPFGENNTQQNGQNPFSSNPF